MQISNIQPDAGSDASVVTNTQQHLLRKRHIQQLLQLALRRMMNARCDHREYSRMTRLNSQKKKKHHLANRYVLNGENRGLHLEPSRDDPKISEIQMLQHSRKDPSNRHRVCKKLQGNQLRHCPRTCTKFQVLILRINISYQNRVPRQCFLTS